MASSGNRWRIRNPTLDPLASKSVPLVSVAVSSVVSFSIIHARAWLTGKVPLGPMASRESRISFTYEVNTSARRMVGSGCEVGIAVEIGSEMRIAVGDTVGLLVGRDVGGTVIMTMMIGCFIVATLLYGVGAQSLPFSFGNETGAVFAPSIDRVPPVFLDVSHVVFDQQRRINSTMDPRIFGLVQSGALVGGICQWLLYEYQHPQRRIQSEPSVGARGEPCHGFGIARNIIAGNGTIFHPQAAIVATWYKVEAFPQQRGPQNTFQLVLAYSATGETWVIFAYAQLQFYHSQFLSAAGLVVQQFFTINSNATMAGLLNGTNCNRTGVYAYRINKGVPTRAPTKSPTKAPAKAPTKSPTKAPTKLPTKAPALAPISTKCGWLGWSVFCPRTLCGVFGRWLGFCQSE
jgi:hypothetical protein